MTIFNLLSGGWGLSFPMTLILIAVILAIVDFFILSDVPTLIAYALVCIAVGWQADAHILYRVIIGLLAWFALVGFHYAVWKRVPIAFANRVIAPDRYKEGAAGLVGSTARVKVVEGKTLICVKDDLWPFECNETLADGDAVEIIAQQNGVLTVKKALRPAPGAGTT